MTYDRPNCFDRILHPPSKLSLVDLLPPSSPDSGGSWPGQWERENHKDRLGGLVSPSEQLLMREAEAARLNDAFEHPPEAKPISKEEEQSVQKLKDLTIANAKADLSAVSPDQQAKVLQQSQERDAQTRDIMAKIDPERLPAVLGNLNKELEGSGLRATIDPDNGNVWIGKKFPGSQSYSPMWTIATKPDK